MACTARALSSRRRHRENAGGLCVGKAQPGSQRTGLDASCSDISDHVASGKSLMSLSSTCSSIKYYMPWSWGERQMN